MTRAERASAKKSKRRIYVNNYAIFISIIGFIAVWIQMFSYVKDRMVEKISTGHGAAITVIGIMLLFLINVFLHFAGQDEEFAAGMYATLQTFFFLIMFILNIKKDLIFGKISYWVLYWTIGKFDQYIMWSIHTNKSPIKVIPLSIVVFIIFVVVFFFVGVAWNSGIVGAFAFGGVEATNTSSSKKKAASKHDSGDFVIDMISEYEEQKQRQHIQDTLDQINFKLNK